MLIESLLLVLQSCFSDHKKASNLEAYVEWFNRLSYLVATEICMVSNECEVQSSKEKGNWGSTACYLQQGDRSTNAWFPQRYSIWMVKNNIQGALNNKYSACVAR